MSTLPTVAAGTGAIPDINANFIAASAAAMYARRDAGTAGLTWGYFGGYAFSNTVANGSVALNASATNYMVASRTTGAVSVSVSTTDWNNVASFYRLYQVVTGAASITGFTDYRDFTGGGGGGSSFTGGTLTSALNEAPTVTIASAATVNIGAAAGNTISLTGTTTVTAFDTLAAGAIRRVVFAGVLTLTHNATSLILPTGANITTAAGDVAEFLSLGAGNWRCLSYTRANGQALASAGGGFTGGTLTSALNEAPQVALASAATVNIGAAAANMVTVSGTTTITAFDSIATGAIRRVRFLGALTLTHNATSLILPAGANITTAAGDVATMESLGSGNWRCINYSKADGTSVAGGGGGVSGFMSTLNTASPNTSTNVSSLTASGGTSNQSAVLAPKGTGGVGANISDSTATGGNLRGTNTVDWQSKRTSSTQVANGTSATISGGDSNTASGTNSTVVGGFNNTASGSGAVVGGASVNSTANYGMGFGASLTVSGDYSFASGRNNTADALCSRIGGSYGKVRGIISADVYGISDLSAGYFQRATYVGAAVTTDATPKVLTADRQPASTNNQIVLSNNKSAQTIKILAVARKLGLTTDSKHWEITLGAYRDVTAASVAIVGTPTVTVIGASAGASAWTLAVSADTTNGAISITGTGAAASTILWDFRADTIEVENP